MKETESKSIESSQERRSQRHYQEKNLVVQDGLIVFEGELGRGLLQLHHHLYVVLEVVEKDDKVAQGCREEEVFTRTSFLDIFSDTFFWLILRFVLRLLLAFHI